MNRNRADGRILVVDDETANLDVLTSLLEKQGYKVFQATRGRQVAGAIARARPDLILLDIRMPEMDGFEVCADLRARRLIDRIPVIFVSSVTDTADKVRGFEAGAVDFIPKPIEPPEVLARVRAHLALRSMRAELEAKNELLREAAARLEERVAQRTAQLERAVKELQDERARRLQAEEAAMRAIESEQTRIGQDIHDGLLQHLSGVLYLCEALESDLQPQSAGLAALAGKISRLIDQSTHMARAIARGLCPAGLETEGLIPALERLIETYQHTHPDVAIAFEVAAPAPLNAWARAHWDANRQTQVYRIAQEALNNALRHSGARNVALSIRRDDSVLIVAVRDDGAGLPPPARIRAGIGMAAMSSRAQSLGASLDYRPAEGGGTVVELRVDSARKEV